jgi:hypothetical protein
VVRQDERRPPLIAERRLAPVEECREGRSGPWRDDHLPVEDEVPVGRQHRRSVGTRVEQLTHREPIRVLVDDGPETLQKGREVGLVAIVEMDLPGPCRRALDDRIREELRMLQEHVEDVQPKAVHPALQPAPNHPVLRRLHLGIAPVQVGLLREERVEVELLASRFPLPRRAAEERDPIVRRDPISELVDPGGVTPQIPVGVGSDARLAAGLEPAVLVARVVHHEVEDDPDSAAVGFVDEPIEVRLRAEERVDPLVIADVVADVKAR